MANGSGRALLTVKFYVNLCCYFPMIVGSFILYSDNQIKHSTKEDKEKNPNLCGSFSVSSSWLSGNNSFVHIKTASNYLSTVSMALLCAILPFPNLYM